MLARDLMFGDVAYVTPDANLGEVARQLAATPTGAVVVVDTARRPIGMVTRSDMERANVEAEAALPIPQWLIKQRPPMRSLPRTPRLVTEVMTAPAISVPDVAQILELVPLMENKRLKRLPVVSSGRLVGLVRRADLLAAIKSGSANTSKIVGAQFTAQAFRELAAQHEIAEEEQRQQAKRLALKEQERLIEELARRRLSDRDWAEMIAGARRAASAGLKECTLFRFPSRLCRDGGRAINAPDRHWPDTLRGEARDVFERWKKELEPNGFGLAAQIVSFPDGVPGDAALILSWSV